MYHTGLINTIAQYSDIQTCQNLMQINFEIGNNDYLNSIYQNKYIDNVSFIQNKFRKYQIQENNISENCSLEILIRAYITKYSNNHLYSFPESCSYKMNIYDTIGGTRRNEILQKIEELPPVEQRTVRNIKTILDMFTCDDLFVIGW
jgi:hypothetical protein